MYDHMVLDFLSISFASYLHCTIHVFRIINKPHFFSQKTTDEISPIRDLLLSHYSHDPIYQQDY